MLARNVHGYTATRKLRVLKVTAPVAAPGAESAVYDCVVDTDTKTVRFLAPNLALCNAV